MKKEMEVEILYKEPKHLRVCFDKDILQPHLDAFFGSLLDEEYEIPLEDREDYVSTFARFLQYVEESAGFMVVVGMKRVYDDLQLLQAFLIDLPQQLLGYGRLMGEIDFLAGRAAFIIWDYNLERMEQHNACGMVRRLNIHLKLRSHWMDLIRMIYGKHPKASLQVYHLVDYLAPLDALLDYLQLSKSSMLYGRESIAKDIVLLRAILTDHPQEFVEDDSTLKEFEFIAKEVGFTISSVDLKHMDRHMSKQMCDRLDYIWECLNELLGLLHDKIYERRPKPSRMYYPKTAQLDFVDHLVYNLGELLVKPKAASLRVLKFDILRFLRTLQETLQEVSCHLMEIPEPRKEEADMKDVITSIANLAYEAEYVIDSFLLGDIIPISYSMLWLRDILKELEQERGLLKMQLGDANLLVSIIRWMNSEKLEIIPIFNNNTEIGDTLRVVLHELDDMFDVCTMSLVSSYKERKKEVFLDLLRNAAFDEDSETDEIDYTSDMSEAELEDSLYNLLEDKHYFIILECVQDIYALNDIKRVLPDNLDYDKRVLLTTPSPELIVQCRHGFNNMFKHHPSTSQTDKPIIENYVVGFMEETESMLEWLTRGPTKLRIISIVGMPGQGKTTLAQKLFSHPSVNEYFDTRARCCVSQVYERRQLLLELLGQVVQLSNTDHHKDDAELAEMLYKHLKGRRFLIFLDDMWEIDAWNNLARCFANDNNGSRIMFTTRIQGLASQAKSDSKVQSLSLLSDDESWALLEKKLFQKESCPIELLGVGRQIAKNCKGLPLSLVLIAGLLVKMEKKVDHWEHIAKSLSSLIIDDVKTQGKGVIELSYKHLPDHLKSCFLYFGAFLEDKEVLVSKLIRLWIAEGFVKHIDLKSLEDVAEDYFTDLIGRSLVTVAQEKSSGGVKSCRVHDLLREFCLTKAKEENFLQKIDGYDHDMDLEEKEEEEEEEDDEENFLHHHDMDPSEEEEEDDDEREDEGEGEEEEEDDNDDEGEDEEEEVDMDPSDSSSSTVIRCHLRRLCIYPKRNHFTWLKPSGPFLRSLLFFTTSDMGPSYSYDISSICHSFKFLKTLNLEGINIGDSFKEIGALNLLRYLACQSYVDLIPSSIANLWDLRTFLFKGLGLEVIKVSDSIWDMPKLRHMHINDSASFELDPNRLENSFILDNLQTFSTPSLAYGDDMEKMLRKVRGIRKLKCIFLDSWNDATNCNEFPELGFLSQLVSLNVFYSGMGKYPCEFNLPSNLKKLTLSNFRMPWNEISQLAKALYNLEVLKLLCNAFEGERWDIRDEVFPKLKFLKLDTLNVVEWSATDYNFPKLKCLLLHNCEQLEEIPSDIGEIPTLQMIEVMWCSCSVAISAINIQKEQLEYGEGLKIHVHPKI